MLPIRSILCPVDFSPHAELVLREAGRLASGHGAAVTVLTVIDPLLAQAAAAAYHMQVVEKQTRDDLETLVRRVVGLTRAPAGAWRLETRVGGASAEIVRLARTERHDLIVMGTHGLTGYRKLFFGSTTHDVLQKTDVPVLVVPPRKPSGKRGRAGPVLAPVDLTPTGRHALETAAAMATALKAPLVLLHVLPDLVVERAGADAPRASDRILRELADLAAHLHAPRIEPRVASGAPAERIAAVAAETGARLIVMALENGLAAGKGRPGTITYRVLCEAAVAVLAVPPARRRAGRRGRSRRSRLPLRRPSRRTVRGGGGRRV